MQKYIFKVNCKEKFNMELIIITMFLLKFMYKDNMI